MRKVCFSYRRVWDTTAFHSTLSRTLRSDTCLVGTRSACRMRMQSRETLCVSSRRAFSLKFSRGWRRPRYTMARLPHHTMPFLARGGKKHRVCPRAKVSGTAVRRRVANTIVLVRVAIILTLRCNNVACYNKSYSRVGANWRQNWTKYISNRT